MSVGHRNHQEHTDALIKETRGILAREDIQKYLGRPFTVDYSRKVPLTGGSSIDGRRYYVDPDVPVSEREFVLWHERVEKAIREVMKETYGVAHRLATCAERLLVESKGKNWNKYKRRVAIPVRENEKRGPETMPKDFDRGPYQESGESRLVKAS